MSGLLLFPPEAGQSYFIASSPVTALAGRSVLPCSWGKAVVQQYRRLKVFGAVLLTFHRAVSKPLLLFTQNKKVGMIQPALMFQCWSLLSLPGAQHCLASSTIKWGTACPWFLSRQHFHRSLYLLKCSLTLCWLEGSEEELCTQSLSLSSDSFI